MNLQQLIQDVRASPVAWRILVAGFALEVAFVVLHVINKLALGDGLLLALDTDPNLPSWATSALFLMAGLACGLLAWLRPGWRRPLGAVAAIALWVSFVQVAQLHKELEKEVVEPWAALIQASIGAGFALVIVWSAAVMSAVPRVLMVGALLVSAASFGSSTMNRLFDLPYSLLIVFQTLEEVCEMLTAVFIIAAVIQPLIDAIATRLSAPVEEPQPLP